MLYLKSSLLNSLTAMLNNRHSKIIRIRDPRLATATSTTLFAKRNNNNNLSVSSTTSKVWVFPRFLKTRQTQLWRTWPCSVIQVRLLKSPLSSCKSRSKRVPWFSSRWASKKMTSRPTLLCKILVASKMFITKFRVIWEFHWRQSTPKSHKMAHQAYFRLLLSNKEKTQSYVKSLIFQMKRSFPNSRLISRSLSRKIWALAHILMI